MSIAYRWNLRDHLAQGRFFVRWLVIASGVGLVVGSAVALFLWALDAVTRLRWSTENAAGIPWLLYLLPIAGAGVGWLYHAFGKDAERGNNLILEQIHEPGGGVSWRMAPLVLVGTIVTHLFGGSAGREGTAVQMGGSLSSVIGRALRLNRASTKTLLTAGVAAGFGAVFGTPIAGAIFAVEVLAAGQISFAAIVPALIASIVGDRVTAAWGIHHTAYRLGNVVAGTATPSDAISWLLLGKIAIAGIAFGLASVLFAELMHGLQRLFKATIASPIWRPAVGAIAVIALAWLASPDYLGLGVTANPHRPGAVTIVSCFFTGGATTWSWWWKLLFTAVTLACGFKGGEVTPLFFIGAALGNTLAILLHAPVDLFAALGFVAVFAGATKTPLACTIMGIELFALGPTPVRPGLVIELAVACFVAYLFSGQSTIYAAQRRVDRLV